MGMFAGCGTLDTTAPFNMDIVSATTFTKKVIGKRSATKQNEKTGWVYSSSTFVGFLNFLYRLSAEDTFMSPNVVKRFTVIMFLAVLVTGGATLFYDSFFDRPKGDYETERGGIFLASGDFDDAMSYFNKALSLSPNHRGALMGRALVFIQTEQYQEAEAELDYLVAWLEKSLSTDDQTGRGVLAAAHANKGIILDRQGAHEKALENYVIALQTDEESVAGPGLVHKILYDPRPSTVRERARYLYEQLQLPKEQRVMRVPELDAKSRMHKP